jgi:AcrR family transcriptional regulator
VSAESGSVLPAPGWRDLPPVELSPILSASLDAFSEVGFHGSTVRDIAARIGVTVPALYYHHENKEALLFALLETSIDRVHHVCAAALTKASEDPIVSFGYLVEALVLHMTNSRKLATLDAEIRCLTPQHRSDYGNRRREIQDILEHAIELGSEAGVFHVTSAADTARALLGMIQAVAVWYRPEGSLSPVELAKKYVDISARAVGASDEVVERLRSLVT